MDNVRRGQLGVLAHLTMRFVDQRENFATEGLAHVINRSKSARSTFARLIADRVIGFPALARVATQEAAGAESRPDLTLVTDDGKTVGYLEAKFWAGLTDAQPVEYIRRLSATGGTAILARDSSFAAASATHFA